VNQLYFSALLLAENEEVIRLKKGMLEERIKVLESMFRNGMVTSRDVELLKAERLLAEQQIGEIYGERAAVIGSLGILTNRQLDEKTRLEVPVISTTNDSVSRPELRYFDLIGSKIDQNSLFLQRNRYPKVFGFGQAGYGKPGLNMLKDNVNPFYMVGLGLSWNIIDWKQTSRSREILEVQKQMVGSQRALFDQNLSSALFRAGESIRKVEKLLKIDDELVAVRNNIVKNSTSQLDNGTITSADYIVDLNAATQAAVSKESHKVQLYQAIANYNTLAGKP
jgi:outer membrane protein TolC